MGKPVRKKEVKKMMKDEDKKQDKKGMSHVSKKRIDSYGKKKK